MSYAPQSSPGPFRLPASPPAAAGPLLAGALVGALASALVGAVPLVAQMPADSSARPAESTGRADRVEAARETSVHAAPDAPPAGALRRGARARVVGRVNGWARVQVDGWVKDADLRPDSAAALTGVSAADVRADPDRYVGQTVDWRLQLIAIQTADDLRPEMIAGQPYLLTRGPHPEAGFVYVTVSKAQADRLRALPPLQELVLRVTIRAARTRYLETPLVDLVDVVSSPAGSSSTGTSHGRSDQGTARSE